MSEKKFTSSNIPALVRKIQECDTEMLNSAKKYTNEKIGDGIKTAIEDYFLENPVEIDNTIQYSTMPAASVDKVGIVIQYVGVTDTDYTKGCFYESVLGDDGTTYSWVKVESPLASSTSDGDMSMTDKVKLDSIEEGAEVNPIRISEIVSDNDYYDKNMISDIAREIQNGKVTKGYRDEVIIPDKYNTGVNNINVENVELFEIIETVTVNDIKFSVSDDMIYINYHSNKNLPDDVIIENLHFPKEFGLKEFANYPNAKKITFNNCKFHSFKNTVTAANGNPNSNKIIFNNCTISGASVQVNNCDFNNCFFGNQMSDAINPFGNNHFNNCYIANIPNMSGGVGLHIDGVQIFGSYGFRADNIHFNNIRFSLPNFRYDELEGQAYVSAAIFVSLERNHADNLTFKDIMIDAGGRWTPLRCGENVKGLDVTNILFKNVKLSDTYPKVHGGISSQATEIDSSLQTDLYVSSVWKDTDNKTHIICTNCTKTDKTLKVKTNVGEYTFDIGRSPTPVELAEDDNYKNYTFEDMPYDVEFIINEDINYLICYDSDTQIRFVNFTNEDVYLPTNTSSADLSNHYTKSEVNELINNLAVSSGSRWANKTLCAFGTSITANCGASSGYLQTLKDTLGLASYTNNGLSGHAISYASGRSGISRKIQETDITPYDLITIEGCTNDFKLNVPLGEVGQMGDTELTDVSNFCQALRKAIEYILTSNPQANILLIADPQRDNSDYDVNYINSAGCKLIDYVDKMIEIGALYGIPVCDLYRNSGINALTLSTYTTDGLHLGNKGNVRVGNVIAAVLNNMYSNTVIIHNNNNGNSGDNGDNGEGNEPTVTPTVIKIDDTEYDISVANDYAYKMIMSISNKYYLYYSNSPFYIYDNVNNYETFNKNDTYRATASNSVFTSPTAMGSGGTQITDSDGYKYLHNTVRTLDQYVWTNADIKYWGTEDVAVSVSV